MKRLVLGFGFSLLTMTTLIRASIAGAQSSEDLSDRRIDLNTVEGILETVITVERGDASSSRTALSKLENKIDATEALEEFYHQLPDGNVELKWATLYVLGELSDKRGAAFLAEVATQTVGSPEEVDLNGSPRSSPSSYIGGPVGGEIQEREEEHDLKFFGASTLVSKYIQNSENDLYMEQLLEDVLLKSEKKIAAVVATELFAEDALTDDFIKILDSRGISHDFRVLSDEERDYFFKSNALMETEPLFEEDDYDGGEQ